jgi:peptidoglycan/LPS O-acetylase OafA/YrhL
MPDLPIFNKADAAVSFFFCLSGFLITYLLINEYKENGMINIKNFYLRRILRIWPLYFSVIFFAFFFYNFLLPHLEVPFKIEYKLVPAIILSIFFLPNYLTAIMIWV